MTKADLKHLARGTEVVGVPADTPVVEQGDHGDGVYVILDGAAKVVRDGRKVAEFGLGSYGGELALLDPGPRTATVVTTAPTRLGILGATSFRVGLRESPRMGERLLASLARRARADGQLDH